MSKHICKWQPGGEAMKTNQEIFDESRKQALNLDWERIRRHYGVSEKFIEEAKQIFEIHAETLRKLAGMDSKEGNKK